MSITFSSRWLLIRYIMRSVIFFDTFWCRFTFPSSPKYWRFYWPPSPLPHRACAYRDGSLLRAVGYIYVKIFHAFEKEYGIPPDWAASRSYAKMSPKSHFLCLASICHSGRYWVKRALFLHSISRTFMIPLHTLFEESPFLATHKSNTEASLVLAYTRAPLTYYFFINYVRLAA